MNESSSLPPVRNVSPLPKLWESVGLVLLQMLVLLGTLLVLGALNALFGWGESGLFYFSLVGEIFLIVPLLGWVLLRRMPVKETFSLRPASGKMIALAVALGVLVWLPANAAALPFEWWLSKIGSAPEIPRPETMMQAIVLGFTVIVAAPLVEEPMFRGFVLRGWLPVGNTAAILVSGILFGMLHGQLAQLVALIIVGILLGVVALRSGSIIPAMALHATFNALSFAAILYQNQLNWLDDADLVKLALVVLPLLVWTLVLLWRSAPAPKIDAPHPTETDWALAGVAGFFVLGLFGVFAALDILSRVLPPSLTGF